MTPATKRSKGTLSEPRILVLSASVGAGHLRAAEAVSAAAKALYPEAIVENRDVLDFTSSAFRKVYSKAYLDLVAKAPHLLGFVYDHLDRDTHSGHKLGDRLRIAVDKLNLLAFEKWLLAGSWDIVINTHFLPAERIARLKAKGKFAAPQVTVCTDFDTHRLWANEPCELYFVATEEGRLHLQHWGISPDKIKVTGIPVMPAFAEPVKRKECCQKMGLIGDRPIVLQMCGGFGVGPVEGVFESLVGVEKPMDLVVICGRNEALKKRLEGLPVPPRQRAHIVGLTSEMDTWMGCADIVVSKPGGLTTSEILARGVAMVVVNPIPGQESRNSDFLLENGSAVKANHPSALRYKMEQLLSDPPRLKRMQAAAKSLGRPRAAFEVVESSMKVWKR